MQDSPPWHNPKKCTCSIWAVRQKLSFGGKIKRIWSPHYRWLPRWIWSPDKINWYGYVPLNPVPKLSNNATKFQRIKHNIKVLKHSLWFEGYVRKEKNREGPLAQ